MTADERYSRQVRYPAIAEAGQAAIGAASVALVGCGALGTVVAGLLVRAGVGRLRIIDRDFVELSNLQRQTLFTERDAAMGRPKAEAAAEHLRAVNSTVTIEAEVADLVPANVERLLGGANLVLDGSDNFEVRLLINDWCVARGVPWVMGSCLGATGQSLTIVPGRTGCFACLVDDPPSAGGDTCDTAGVLGPVSHAVGSIIAIEGLKLLVGDLSAVAPGFLVFDLWENTWRRLNLPRNRAGCRCCDRREFDWLEGRKAPQAAKLCGRNAVQITPADGSPSVDLDGLARQLVGRAVRVSPYLLRFEADGLDVSVFPDGRAIVRGTEDVARARTLMHRLLGG